MERSKPTVQSYKDLEVWQMAMDAAAESYRLTSTFPKEEAFGMTAQIRRASVSVPANIAEGHGRETTGAFIQFLRIAQGSLKELETHLLLAERVGLARINETEKLTELVDRVGKMMRSLIRTLQEKR